MKDLYDMTREEAVEMAKRNIVDCIYSSARIEGIGVTFPDTQQIYEGRSIAGLSIDEINKVNNLKHAWQFLFDSLDYPMDILYLRQLNQIVNAGLMSDAGSLRNYDVNIGGTSWKPELPERERIIQDLAVIMETECCTERAIKLMLYVMRTQMFSDGNKRVAQLAANQILLQSGKGLLRIPVDKSNEFFELLVNYYETNDGRPITEFLYRSSILGKRIVKNEREEPVCEEMFIKRKHVR